MLKERSKQPAATNGRHSRPQKRARRQPKKANTHAFDLLVVCASAGGQVAVIQLMRSLPRDFPIPMVVMQHLGPESQIQETYARQIPFDVQWARMHSPLAPGSVILCPPRAFVELLPDGTCRLSPCENGARDKPIDKLLDSVARSFGPRAIAVILTGMGNDGATGARELHLAGGSVLVQSEESAEYPAMPRAAIQAGAADLVVPLEDLAQVVCDLIAGTTRPRPRSEMQAINRVFGDNGDVAACARDIDWTRTPLGPVMSWPADLRMSTRTMIDSAHAMAIWWGRDLVQIYNDEWSKLLGPGKHPRVLGGRARDTWPDLWNDIGPMVDQVMTKGEAVAGESNAMLVDRQWYREEVFLTFSYSPIRDAAGTVLGVQVTGWNRTSSVVAERRVGALRALATQVVGVGTPRDACERAAAALQSDAADIPFALLYLNDDRNKQATLAGIAGLDAGTLAAPRVLSLSDDAIWPLKRVLSDSSKPERAHLLVEELGARFADLPAPQSWPRGREWPRAAMVMALQPVADKPSIGAVIIGLSPHRPFDDGYRNFLDLVAQQIDAAITEARARQLERERSDRLAELDRTKTEFFANVSHEFRTPLALMLGPLEELLERRDQLTVPVANDLELAARNARRLLSLVNSLLDFSQIETRRQHAHLEPTDLVALTADIASAFRSAIESAGLRFVVHCERGLQPVPVDRDMWEKIVSNLLSNALKFTFEGEIAIRLTALSLHAQLVVSDTGIGIPENEMPNLFKRFHRIPGASGRTVEGSGIGLSIVHDLVTRMGGQIRVMSRLGKGSAFTIWLPYQSVRMTSVHRTEAATEAEPLRAATRLASEASQWIVDPVEPSGVVEDLVGPGNIVGADSGREMRQNILVVDDNGDLRQYLQRLLGARWDVQLASNGAEALDAAQRDPPDLIVADVMMPGMDGFQLLKQMRADPHLAHTPVILLTARAGEDAAIEGLKAGADDYIAKPFSPRELIARVGGQIVLSRARRRTEELNAFLVRFSDAVRGERDPEAIARIARRMIRDQLGARSAYWCVVDWATREYVVTNDEDIPGKEVARMRQPIDAWEPFTTIYMQGRTLVVDDAAAAAVDQAQRDGWAQMNIGAALAAPVLVEGTLRAVLGVDQSTPRHWTSEEVALIQGLAGRCWPEVERARAEMALRESEAKFRAVFETMIEACCIFEMIYDDSGKPIDWKILEANAGYETQSGLKDVAGKLASEVMPGTEAYWIETFARVVETGEAEQIEKWHQPTGRWIHSSTARVGGSGSRRLVSVFYDITERKRAEIALRESERQTAEDLQAIMRLYELGKQCADPALDFSTVLHAIVDVAIALTGADKGNVQLLDQQSGCLRIVAQRGFAEPFLKFFGAVRADDAAVCGQAFHSSVRVVVEDVQRSEIFAGQPSLDVVLAAGVRAVQSTPLTAAKGHVFGMISTHFAAPHQPGERELRLLDLLARQAADYLERRQVDEALRESEKRLERELADTLQLQAISGLFFDHDNIQPIWDAIVKASAALMRSDAASLQMFDPEKHELQLLASQGFHPDSARYWQRVPIDTASACDVALAGGQRAVVFDVNDPASGITSGSLQEYRRSNLTAMQSTPLVSRDGREVGMISTHWTKRYQPNERELAQFDLLARQAADVIDRMRFRH